ncbi:MAG TPA: VWA domain-containing protein [Kiritimatiellia bacterium]|nr:VWA domain-containing protein [Kiritimatiellia bacterium]
MGQFAGQKDPVKRIIIQRHFVAGVVAVVVSVIFHVMAITGIKSFPLLPSVVRSEVKRFASVEMRDIQLEPPPMREVLERRPLDAPGSDVPPDDLPSDVWTELKASEPLLLPLPEPVAQPVESEPPAADAFPAAVRQEVMAIPDALFADSEIALPRRWVEQDIPRIDKAPDIQLPVDISDVEIPSSSEDMATLPKFFMDMESGTPDWAQVMGRRGIDSSQGTLIKPGERIPDKEDLLEERPEEISVLQPIEDLLQVRVSGYRSPAGDASLYFSLHIERASEHALPTQPRDILFIQDTSASMTPVKLDECRRGLKRWLDFMNPGDRFEVMGFRDDVYACFNGWREYSESSRREAFRFIDSMRAVGNTDVFQSMQSALMIEPDPARTMLLVLITDGRPTVGVTDSSAIIEKITRYNQGRISMFSVGGGVRVNSFFLDLISYRNRGEAVIARHDEQIADAMEEWAKQLRHPVLTDLSFRFSKVESADVFPKQLTHLYLDRPLVIYGKLPAGVDSFAFQIVGRSGTSWHDMLFVIDREHIAPTEANIRNQWAWQKIYHMIGDYLGDNTDERLEAIRAFSDEYGLVVPYGFSRALPRR